MLISDECHAIEPGCNGSAKCESSSNSVSKTADDLDVTDVNVVADEDSDGCWTDASSSEASDDDAELSDSAESDDSADGAFSGGFHGGQHHKRTRSKLRDCGNEKLVRCFSRVIVSSSLIN